MRTYGLIGHPLGHSFSKMFFTDKFENEEIDAEYQNLLEHPVTTAEKIMANNSSASLLAINNMNV